MVSPDGELADCEAFDWDEGNQDKNWGKHKVSDGEAEQVFFNAPLVAGKDPSHPRAEKRYYALGQTDAGRRLFIAFTVRNHRIRILLARGMTRREQRRYEDAKKAVEKSGT
jgi:uncharacterized DUF497 family protein